MRVADYIMERLAEAGAAHLFMVTGRGVLYLSDAAAKNPDISCVPVHHEQAGAYAAMAYAQYNGKIGACLVSTGCASTNAITGVLCAWQDDVPCVFVSGQNTLKETTRHTGLGIRTYGQQEADIVTIVSSITKYAVMIDDPSKIAYEIDKALYLMSSGRKGPVWIDVPLDIQNMRIEPETLDRFKPPHAETSDLSHEVDAVASLLRDAKRPIIFIGPEVFSSEAVTILREFCAENKIPAVCSNSAVDILPSAEPLSLGVVSTLSGNRAANFAVQNADFVLALGDRLTSMTVGGDASKFAREATVVAVGGDEAEFLKETVKFSKTIVADVGLFIVALKIRMCGVGGDWDSWRGKCLHWKTVFPKCEQTRRLCNPMDMYCFADALGSAMPDNAIVVVDAGLEELIVPSTISFKQGQRCIQPASQGAMGYALPAAYGAWLASKSPVICVTGDGSAMMNLQELQTICHNAFPIKLFIVNNECYAVIRKRQQDLFRTRTVGTDPANGVSCPDYRKVADAFGIKYEAIRNESEMSEMLEQIFRQEGPVLCEVFTTPDQTVLHSSFARTKEGRFVQRPIEDQSPYMDRDVFLREMVIEPIDQ